MASFAASVFCIGDASILLRHRRRRKNCKNRIKKIFGLCQAAGYLVKGHQRNRADSYSAISYYLARTKAYQMFNSALPLTKRLRILEQESLPKDLDHILIQATDYHQDMG